MKAAFDEIEGKTYKSFIEIAANKQYQLLSFTSEVESQMDYGFDKTEFEIENSLKHPNVNDHVKEALKKLRTFNYKQQHADYFNIVDFFLRYRNF